MRMEKLDNYNEVVEMMDGMDKINESDHVLSSTMKAPNKEAMEMIGKYLKSKGVKNVILSGGGMQRIRLIINDKWYGRKAIDLDISKLRIMNK
jgi:uncharacterized radical SAM superfamily protein